MKKDTVKVPRTLLRTILDVAVSSLDFGSGFWDQEDTDAARAVAELLGVCPQAATPPDMRSKYPACAGTEAFRKKHANWTETNLRLNLGHEAH